MKTEEQRKNKRRTGKTFRILNLVFIPMLLTIFLLMAKIKSAELNKFTPKFSSLNGLSLIYNNIDAANFPRIVSLVTVMDDAGLIIEKLDENNFNVYEDNVRELPIEVVELTNADVGINVVLTIDRSSSMYGRPISDAKIAATTFIELMQSKDNSAIVSFAGSPRTDHPFSGNKDSLKAAISKIVIGDWTAVYDALIHSVYLMSDELINRAIILLSDGEDNRSMHTYQEALAVCLSHEIRVFTIGLGLNRNSYEENVLKSLANETGGLYYYSPTSSDLEEIYRAISKLLHHRYQISYTTHNPAKDGTLRHVRIHVDVNKNTSSDTANYRAPFEPGPVDTLDPVDPEPEEPPFEVVPNPFTPNDDGFNDWSEFKKGDDFPLDWDIAIMDRAGRLIRQLTHGEQIWDGKDKSGKAMLPGFYLYIVTSGNQVVHRGLIQLIR